MRVLVVNPGSSSLKLRILSASDEVIFEHDAPVHNGILDTGALSDALDTDGDADAAGVRVVHGGELRRSTIVDDATLGSVRAAVALAPLHNPAAVAAIDFLRRARPKLAVVACLDSAFHTTLPDAASLYAVPWSWIETWKLRRLGFHGFSHAYAARRAGELRGMREARVVTCHLGAGASLAAVRNGESVDTTMGFTPLDGLVMATRSGSVDPGALLWFQQRTGLGASQIERALDREAGLLGLSGVSGEMADVLAAARDGHERARIARDVYLHRLRAGIAAMAAAMDGLDALVFTGGVGEGSDEIRAAATNGLGFLGVAIDDAANTSVTAGADVDITSSSAPVSTFVVHAREDLALAAEVRRVVAQLRR